jgi:hypothetical protein
VLQINEIQSPSALVGIVFRKYSVNKIEGSIGGRAAVPLPTPGGYEQI